MLIERFINSKKDNVQPGGGNKKCYLFDEYALLYGAFKEEELKKQIIISNNLNKKGVAIIPTLEYQIDIPAGETGYARGYMLQPRAPGNCLYVRQMPDKDYKTRLKQIANMEYDILDKFISDWLAIIDAGLQVDPSKCENFFFTDTGISFIDLNLQSRRPSLKTIFLEIVSVLTGLGLVKTAATDDCVQIVKKVANSFLSRGLSIHEIQDALSSHMYLLGANANQQHLDSVIESLAKGHNLKQATKNMKSTPTHLTLIQQSRGDHNL